jgi:hypothetical protein
MLARCAGVALRLFRSASLRRRRDAGLVGLRMSPSAEATIARAAGLEGGWGSGGIGEFREVRLSWGLQASADWGRSTLASETEVAHATPTLRQLYPLQVPTGGASRGR